MAIEHDDDGYMEALLASLDEDTTGPAPAPTGPPLAPVVPMAARAAANRTPTGAKSWDQVDMALVLSDDYVEPMPTVGDVDGTDICLFYQGEINTVFGESGAGKSWFLAFITSQEIKAGNDVLLIDYEDSPGSIAARLKKVGLTAEEIIKHLIYVSPEEKWDTDAAIRIATLLNGRSVTLAIIDSAGEGMAADGANPNADDEVARWMRGCAKTLARLGAAVVTIDHVGKDRSNGRPNGPVGSFRKKAAVVCAYSLQAVVAPSRTRDGLLKLVCDKDRHGWHDYPATAAEIKMTNSDDGSIVMTATKPLGSDGQPWRPETLMGRVCDALAEAGEPLSHAALRKSVAGKAKYVDLAIEHLVAAGNVKQSLGARGAKLVTLVRHIDDDPVADDDPIPF
jgi:hypothetical protein